MQELDEAMAEPAFWENQEQAREVIDESNRLKGWVNPWRELLAKSEELGELVELLEEESDAELEEEWEREVSALERSVAALELRTMLQGEDDHLPAISLGSVDEPAASCYLAFQGQTISRSVLLTGR